MSAELRRQTNVIQTPCALTRKARMSVAVLKVLREMVKPAQVKYDDFLYSPNICPGNAHLIFGHTILTLVKSSYFIN